MSIWKRLFGSSPKSRGAEPCSTKLNELTALWGFIEKAPKATSRRRSEQTTWMIAALQKMGRDDIECLAAQFCEALRVGRSKEIWMGLKYFREEDGSNVGLYLHAYCTWVMLHGHSVYEAFLSNPDSLAEIASIEYEWDVYRGGYEFIRAFEKRLGDLGLKEQYQFKMSDEDQEKFARLSPKKGAYPRLSKARDEYLRLPLFSYSGQPEGMRHESGQVRARNRSEALLKLAELKIRVDRISQV